MLKESANRRYHSHTVQDIEIKESHFQKKVVQCRLSRKNENAGNRSPQVRVEVQ